MPQNILTNSILLPSLKLNYVYFSKQYWRKYYVEKTTKDEICPKCATLSSTKYDKRSITVKDAPIRGVKIYLVITKRRFYCKTCKKPFTEPIPGILPGKRTTQRFKKSILWACRTFKSLKDVRRAHHCSTDFVYKALYESLELELRRQLSYPWPKVLGIDEHNFKKRKRYHGSQFVTMFVDYSNKRIREIALGKSGAEIIPQISHIKGRENVKQIALDLCDPYKKIARELFPNAQIVADKFHVLRLFNPIINKYRKDITGDKRSNPVRKLLLRARRNLEYYEKSALDKWLSNHDELREIYLAKEALHNIYRIKGSKKAEKVFTMFTDTLAHTQIKELKRIRRTLMKWRREILNYFLTRLTNARTEGFNNKAKVVKRNSYGFRSFKNYRLRVLNAAL